MSSRDVTSIQVSKDTWNALRLKKQDPAESFDDVIRREALDEEE